MAKQQPSADTSVYPLSAAALTDEDRAIADRNNQRAGDKTLSAQYRLDGAADYALMRAMSILQHGR